MCLRWCRDPLLCITRVLTINYMSSLLYRYYLDLNNENSNPQRASFHHGNDSNASLEEAVVVRNESPTDCSISAKRIICLKILDNKKCRVYWFTCI